MLALLPAKKKAAANSKARKSASESILAAVQVACKDPETSIPLHTIFTLGWPSKHLRNGW